MAWDDGGPIDTLYYNAGACFPELICGGKDETQPDGVCQMVMHHPEGANRYDYFKSGDNCWCSVCGNTKQISEDAFNYLEWLEEAFREGGY